MQNRTTLHPAAQAPPTLTPEQREQFIRDGYVIVRGLLPPAIVEETREKLLAALEIDPGDPATWAGKVEHPHSMQERHRTGGPPIPPHVVSDLGVIALTEPCRTEGVEVVAEQLAGRGFVRGACFSPYLDAKGIRPSTIRGYIPVLNFPVPGPKVFEKPRGYHIDGMDATTLWPRHSFLVVFAYLTDTAEYGGATTVRPGSHRQVFEHWVRERHPGSTIPPDLDYAEPVPMPGRAGDVIFMHYLAVHSGSANHSGHIRVGLNAAVLPDPQRPYHPRTGAPRPAWTPLDWTLRTDNLVPGARCPVPGPDRPAGHRAPGTGHHPEGA